MKDKYKNPLTVLLEEKEHIEEKIHIVQSLQKKYKDLQKVGLQFRSKQIYSTFTDFFIYDLNNYFIDQEHPTLIYELYTTEKVNVNNKIIDVQVSVRNNWIEYNILKNSIKIKSKLNKEMEKSPQYNKLLSCLKEEFLRITSKDIKITNKHYLPEEIKNLIAFM